MTADTRDRLIESTRELLWDRGYSATSPRAILEKAGVGQGSMYHHFRGKEDLALSAIHRNADDMREQVVAELAGPGTAVDRVARYLHRERDVLKGCRFGRLAQDPDVADSVELQGAVREMFEWLGDQLAVVIGDGQSEGDIPLSLDAKRVAATIIATLQGGYVLARATQDIADFNDAVDGLLDMLSLLAPLAPRA